MILIFSQYPAGHDFKIFFYCSNNPQQNLHRLLHVLTMVEEIPQIFQTGAMVFNRDKASSMSNNPLRTHHSAIPLQQWISSSLK